MSPIKTGRPITSSASSAPYMLRDILRRHGIEQKDLRHRLRYDGGARAGQVMAATTLSTLLTRREWPVTIAREDIEAETEKLLRERGVPDEEIKKAWVIDGQVDAHAHPRRSRIERQITNPDPQEAPIDLPEKEMLSPQARQHFGLPRHPFIDDVQGPQDVYLSREQRYIRESMYYAAKHSGIIAVIGESGSGKTTLRRDLIDRVRRDNEPIMFIIPQVVDKQRLTAEHICDSIIADLSTEPAKKSLEAKGRQIQRVLAASAKAGNTHCLVIEEAHDLSNSTLKYLKRFWELEDGFKKLVGIVLVGQPELGVRLDERRNPDIREFIRRCEVAHLRPLNGNLEEYLTLKFKRVGVELAAIFDADAFDAIRERLTRRRQSTNEVESQLYPQVVHNLITKAMNAAVELGLPKINAQLVGRV